MNNIQFDQEIYKKLTPREIEIIKAAADGLNTIGAAEHLSIARKTVEVHRHNIIAKLKCGTIAGAVAILLRGRIIF